MSFADIKAAFKRFQRHKMTDHAASLTYFTLMSLFPALLFGIAVLGVFGQKGLVTHVTDYLRDNGAPKETVNSVQSALNSAINSGGTAITALIIGLVVSLNGASGAFGAAGRALNVVYRVDEGRGFVKKKLNDIGWTLVVIVLVLITFVLIFMGGGLASDLFDTIGLGSTASTVWSIVRWPGAIGSAMLIYAVVYYAAPNVKIPAFKWITPGAVFGVLLWLLASALFFVYVSNFGSYNATYGAFAGAVILLIWLWITNIALLFGAELNAVVDLRKAPELPDTYDGPPLPEKEPAEV